MTVDRNALARDLEALGANATAASLRNGSIGESRVRRNLASLRDAYQKEGRSALADSMQEVIDRHWGRGRERV